MLKNNLRFSSLLTVLIAALFLAACASKPQVKEEQPAPAAAPAPAPEPTAAIEAPKTAAVAVDDLAALKDPANILSKRSVYFDFDRYAIKNEFLPMIEAHAKFLAGHPQDKIRIQGNADERGSREYNLALGQKRAEAVKKSLTLYGAAERQVEAVSFGEEKPVCAESNEECWSKNRSGDILHGLAKEF